MNPPKKRVLSDAAMKQIEAGQMELLSHALIGAVEQWLGRVPSDDEILRLGRHAMFIPGKATVFDTGDDRFNRFYIWNNEHVLALGFNDPTDPLLLKVCEVPTEDWPPALKAMIEDNRKESA